MRTTYYQQCPARLEPRGLELSSGSDAIGQGSHAPVVLCRAPGWSCVDLRSEVLPEHKDQQWPLPLNSTYPSAIVPDGHDECWSLHDTYRYATSTHARVRPTRRKKKGPERQTFTLGMDTILLLGCCLGAVLLVVVVVVVRRRGREEEGGGETAGCPRSKPDDDGSVPNARRCDAAPCPADGRADGRTGACLEPALSVPPLAPAEAPWCCTVRARDQRCQRPLSCLAPSCLAFGKWVTMARETARIVHQVESGKVGGHHCTTINCV